MGAQQARNLVTTAGDELARRRFLTHDRDVPFAPSFDQAFRSEGLRVITTPARAPRANAVCERFIGPLRRERLDWTPTLHRRQLEAVAREDVEHHNAHRPTLARRPPHSARCPPPERRRLPPADATAAAGSTSMGHHEHVQRDKLGTERGTQARLQTPTGCCMTPAGNRAVADAQGWRTGHALALPRYLSPRAPPRWLA